MTKQPSKLTETDIATLAASVEAPESLHRRVQGMVADSQRQRRAPERRRIGWASPRRPIALVGGTALAAVAGAVLAVTLPGGGGGGPLTPQRAAALTLAPATLQAPGESPTNHSELAVSVGGVAFPYWKERFGWSDSGARSDTLVGRPVTTVFYSNSQGQRIGYAIVAGPAPASGGGTVVRRWGVSYRLSYQNGANVIVWRRGGHLCVMAGRGVSPGTLLALASWGSRARKA